MGRFLWQKKKKSKQTPKQTKYLTSKAEKSQMIHKIGQLFNMLGADQMLCKKKMTGKQDEEGGDEDGRFTLRDKE